MNVIERIFVVVVGSVFFSNINKGYIHTFYSLGTGGQMTIRNFRVLEDDGLRAAAVFKRNKNQWKSIYDEVKDEGWGKDG